MIALAAIVALLVLWLGRASAQEAAPAVLKQPEEGKPADEAKGEPIEKEDAPPPVPIQLKGVLPEDASGADILEHGKNLFEYGDYPGMVAALKRGLDLNRFKGEQLTEAHRLLGIGYFILQNRAKSHEHFLRLLTQNPDFQLDPLYVPPIIIEFFETIREENREMLEAIRAEREKKEEEDQQAEPSVIVRRKNPYYVNFVPFGAGQFQNDEPIKGTLFLSAETLALGLNVTGFFMSKSFEGNDGYYSPGDASAARKWRIVQYSALGAFGALVIGGIIDALVNYEEYED